MWRAREVGIRSDAIALGLRPEVERADVVALTGEQLEDGLASGLCALHRVRFVVRWKLDS